MNLLTRRTFLLGGGLSLASYLAYEVNAVRTVRYTVPVRNLPPPFHGFTILHLSDLHQKFFGRNQARLLSHIGRCRFDMVAMTGDLLNYSRPDAGPVLALIDGLTSKPQFSVNGNNECLAWYEHHFEIATRLGDAGVSLLKNSAVPLQRSGRHIWIAGVDDPVTGMDNLTGALSGVKDGAPVVLLAHSPDVFPRAVEAGVDLVLAGHTHGGQVRLPFVGALWGPDLEFLPRWDHGQFRQGETTLIVNSGLGESTLPLRVCNPPEIALVTLTPLKGTADA